jgi:S-adenosylmethionine decarboxylase
MTDVLRKAAEAAQATILHLHVHEFGGEGGVSGVAVLAESHISVHTWPELDYAAFDVFMCGNCYPEKAVAVLEKFFAPRRKEISQKKRGLIE